MGIAQDRAALAAALAALAAVLAFIGGYLYRADLVATGRRPPKGLMTKDDVDPPPEGERTRQPWGRPGARRKLATNTALGLVAGLLAAVFIDAFTGLWISIGALVIPGGLLLMVVIEERSRPS